MNTGRVVGTNNMSQTLHSIILSQQGTLLSDCWPACGSESFYKENWRAVSFQAVKLVPSLDLGDRSSLYF